MALEAKINSKVTAPTIAAANAVYPLTLSIRVEKPFYRISEALRIWLRVQNTGATASATVRYGVELVDPLGKPTDLITSVQTLEAVAAGHDEEFELLSGTSSIHTWAASDAVGQYMMAFRAYDGSGAVLGCAITTMTFGTSRNEDVICELIPDPDKQEFLLGDRIEMSAHIANNQATEILYQIYLAAAAPNGEFVEAVIPADQNEPDGQRSSTMLPYGELTSPVIFDMRTSSGYPWANMPHDWADADSRGRYYYYLAVCDWTGNPDPSSWRAHVISDVVLAISFRTGESSADGVDLFDQVLVHHKERIDPDDFDKLSRGPMESMRLILGAFSGFTGTVTGGDLFIRNGAVWAKPAYGWVWSRLMEYYDPNTASEGELPKTWERNTDPPNSPENPAFEQQRVREQYGAHPFIQTAPELYVDSFALHPPDEGKTRYDVILIGPFAKDGAVDPQSETGTDKRLFVDETRPQSDGRPLMETKDVATRRRTVAKLAWMRGMEDPNNAWLMDIPEGWIPLGYVLVNGIRDEETGEYLPNAVGMRNDYPPQTVTSHRAKSPIDHPGASIYARHLSEALSGGYIEGEDMSFREMSLEIQEARGTFPGPDGIHERLLQGGIDEDGTLMYEAVEGPIRAILEALLGDIVDQHGNLLPGAVTGAIGSDGSTVASLSGEVQNGGQVPRLAGFGDDEQHAVVFPAKWNWTFGGNAVTVSAVEFICNNDLGNVSCNTKCTAHTATVDFDIDTGGTAGFLVVGSRPMGT